MQTSPISTWVSCSEEDTVLHTFVCAFWGKQIQQIFKACGTTSHAQRYSYCDQ